MTPHMIDVNSRMYRYVRRFTHWRPEVFNSSGERVPNDICSFRRALIGLVLYHMFVILFGLAIYSVIGLVIAKGVIQQYDFSLFWAIVAGAVGPAVMIAIALVCVFLMVLAIHLCSEGIKWAQRKVDGSTQSQGQPPTIIVMWRALKDKYCVPIKVYDSKQPNQSE